jgi:hypothetical protein
MYKNSESLQNLLRISSMKNYFTRLANNCLGFDSLPRLVLFKFSYKILSIDVNTTSNNGK